MKTQVEFRFSKFPPYEGEQEQINPGLWGKRLAEYFVQKLSEKGVQDGGDEYFPQSPKLDVLRSRRSVARHLVCLVIVLTRRMKNRCRDRMTILRYSYLRATIGSTRMARRAGM